MVVTPPGAFLCAIRHSHTCDMSRSCACHDSFKRVRITRVHAHLRKYSYIWREWFICICDMTHMTFMPFCQHSREISGHTTHSGLIHICDPICDVDYLKMWHYSYDNLCPSATFVRNIRAKSLVIGLIQDSFICVTRYMWRGLFVYVDLSDNVCPSANIRANFGYMW